MEIGAVKEDCRVSLDRSLGIAFRGADVRPVERWSTLFASRRHDLPLDFRSL